MSAGLLDGLRTGKWLDEQTFPDLRFAVPGVIPEGFTLLVGPPKIGKSWFVLALLLAVSSGGHALGSIRVGRPRPTLYLALEDGDRRLQQRARDICVGDPLPVWFEYMTRVEPGQVTQTISEWLEKYGEHHPVVVLDTLGKVMPAAIPGESAYQRDYRVGGALKRLVDDHPGASLVVNHHDRKALSVDFVDSVSGTHGLAGAADTILHLSRDRNTTSGLLKVTGRDVTEAEYALTTGKGWFLDGATLEEAASKASATAATAGVGDRSVEIVQWIAKQPGQKARSGEVEAQFGDGARQNLKRLVDSGRLDRASRGVYLLPLSQPSQVTKPGLQLVTRDGCDTPYGEEQE